MQYFRKIKIYDLFINIDRFIDSFFGYKSIRNKKS